MRIIFLNRFFHPDYSATSQMLSQLSLALVKMGWDVHVIASRQRYDDPKARLSPRECVGGVETHRVWTARFGRNGLALRAIDYFTFYLSAAWRLQRLVQPGDIVIAATDPPLLSVIALPIVWLRGGRLVNWLHDIFPEVAGMLGVGGGASRFLFRPLRWLRNWSLRGAAVNVALGERMAERLRQEGVPATRIAIIPNWADGRAVRPVAPRDNALRAEWGLADSFVVGYSGNLGRAHDIDTMLEAMTALRDADVVFLFIGGGAHYARLRHEAEARKLTNIRIRPYQPVERLSESLSVPDVHLVSLQPGLEGLIVPSKLYGVMAAGRPALFIGDLEGDVARTLQAEHCGVAIEQGDGAALTRHIVELARDPERRLRMGERARSAFEARFDKEIAFGKWAEELDALTQAHEKLDACAAPSASSPRAA
jgi:colanic acid biosynthesis glycosyl transferase WcaI